MTEPTTPDTAPVARRVLSRNVKLAIVAVIAWLLVTGVALAVYTVRTLSSAPQEPAALDYCAVTDDGTMLRSKLVYTDTRFLNEEPDQVNDDDNGRWCVFSPNYDTGIHWAAVYVGEDNPLYRTMLAENGADDNASRAVIGFQGVPPVKFARDGWVAFVAQDEDGEKWTAFRTGAGAMLLDRIATSAEGNEAGK